MPKQAFPGYAEYVICPTVSLFTMPPDAPVLYFPFQLAWLRLFGGAELHLSLVERH